MNEQVGFISRVWLAIVVFFKILADGTLALEIRRTLSTEKADQPQPDRAEKIKQAQPEEKAENKNKPSRTEDGDNTSREHGALSLLGSLQREGRLVDFLTEDIALFTDDEVGAAARGVHLGCRKVLDDHFKMEAVWPADEESQVVVEEGFDPHRIQLTGNVSGDPPFQGILRHRGWRVSKCKLPESIGKLDPAIVTPAEVEL